MVNWFIYMYGEPAQPISVRSLLNQITVMNTKEEEVKATWKIPRALLREFKHFAADDDTTVTALVITAMKEFAARRKSGSKK
jgi:hypothetical protein